MPFNFVLYLLNIFRFEHHYESFVDETRVWRKYKISILVSDKYKYACRNGNYIRKLGHRLFDLYPSIHSNSTSRYFSIDNIFYLNAELTYINT